MSCIIIINQFVCKLYIKTQKPNVSEDHKYGIGVKKGLGACEEESYFGFIIAERKSFWKRRCSVGWRLLRRRGALLGGLFVFLSCGGWLSCSGPLEHYRVRLARHIPPASSAYFHFLHIVRTQLFYRHSSLLCIYHKSVVDTVSFRDRTS